jgi:hypothetical protein
VSRLERSDSAAAEWVVCVQHVSVRMLQGVKFALLIFMAGHWVIGDEGSVMSRYIFLFLVV